MNFMLGWCPYCRAPVYWLRTQGTMIIRVNAEVERPGTGNIEYDRDLCEAVSVRMGEGGYTSHFSTCTYLEKKHRKEKRERKNK